MVDHDVFKRALLKRFRKYKTYCDGEAALDSHTACFSDSAANAALQAEACGRVEYSFNYNSAKYSDEPARSSVKSEYLRLEYRTYNERHDSL